MGVHFPHIATVEERQPLRDRPRPSSTSAATRSAPAASSSSSAWSSRDFYRIFHWDGDERYEPYQGVGQGQGRIEYTLGYPGDSQNGTMVLDIDLAITEAELDGYRVQRRQLRRAFQVARPRARLQGRRARRIERFGLRKGAGTVNLSGRIERNGVLDLVLLGDRSRSATPRALREARAGPDAARSR